MTIDHYHIRWVSGKLDWEKFRTEQEAVQAAENLKRHEETYTIMPSPESCEHCNSIRPKG